MLIDLRAQYDYLTKTEKKIADFILKDPRRFITCSVVDLSKESGVSQGSINNFSRKFSAGGYTALKLRIASCIGDRDRDEGPFSVVDVSQGMKQALAVRFADTEKSLKDTMRGNDEAAMRNAAERILRAKKVEIYGVFQSGIVAEDFYYQLIQLGIPVSFVSDMLMCAVSASMLDRDSLVIAVSSSGRTKELIEAVEIAREGGVPVICLTGNRLSPLAQMSDDVLLAVPSGNSLSSKSAETRMAQLFVIDALCAYIRSALGENGKEYYYRLRRILGLHSVYE